MALNLYSKPDLNYPLSITNPLTFTFNGKIGGLMNKCVYLRNDNPDRYYTNIVITAVDTSDIDITNGSIKDWIWKLMYKSITPYLEEWAIYNNTLTVPYDLGTALKTDIVTYLPIWVYVKIPRFQQANNIVSVFLRITGKEVEI